MRKVEGINGKEGEKERGERKEARKKGRKEEGKLLANLIVRKFPYLIPKNILSEEIKKSIYHYYQ